MKALPIRTVSLQVLSIIAVYSFAWTGELLFMAGEFFGVFFDIFVMVGFAILFLSCLSYCFMLMANGKQKMARNLMITIIVLIVVNFSWVMPSVEAALLSSEGLPHSLTALTLR